MYLKWFVSAGYNVKFIGDNFFPHQPYTTILEQLGVEVLYGNYYAGHWKNWFLENAKYIDVVYLHRPHIAPNYLEFVANNSSAKIVYQCHDLHHWRVARAAEFQKDSTLQKEAAEWKEKELALFNSVDVGLSFSCSEVDYLKGLDVESSVHQIPLFLYEGVEVNSPDFKQRQDFMFVGSFGHKPNAEGVYWFLKNVMPIAVEALPTLVFHIVGSNMPDEIKQLVNENVQVHGHMTDAELSELYRSVKVNILPLQHGAGVKGKLVESMQLGTPVVSTSIGLEGVDADRLLPLAADTPEDFAAALLKLMTEEAAWNKTKNILTEVFIDNFVIASNSQKLLRIF
jgi:glycosyltransferase involved in cell wall biosynthesis